MSGLKIFFLSAISVVGVSASAYQKPAGFMILFPSGTDKLTPAIKRELRLIGSKISVSTEPSFSIVCYGRKNLASRGWARGYNIITFLRDSVSVPKQKLRLFYDAPGNTNMVLI